MLVRFTKESDGTTLRKASVYTLKEHGIHRWQIDPDAVKIVFRLRSAGHTAYIVGGAVRDLLAGRKPKDFDVVTDAPPRKIKTVFRNSRIIGKRFRLVHIFFQDKNIEVSTYRALTEDGENNTFGTLVEDYQRRDFSFNALYYSPVDETIVDYVNGVKDIRAKRLRAVLPLASIFVEDPVRMLRGVKYAAVLGFKIPLMLGWKIRSQAQLLASCSASRLTEEVFKILLSRAAAPVIRELDRYGLLKVLVPELSLSIQRHRSMSEVLASLAEFDQLDDEHRSREKALEHLLKPVLRHSADLCEGDGGFQLLFHEVKQLMKPIVPSNKEVEAAVASVLHKKKPRHLTPRPRRRRRRRPGPKPAESTGRLTSEAPAHSEG